MPPAVKQHVDLSKTISYLLIHLSIGFGVAYLFTGSIAVAGGIALVEPLVNAVAFFFHEKIWKRALAGAIVRFPPIAESQLAAPRT
ncbi:MAG TPA: DUF2061 domain-containing protein [Nitrospira sp.]|nr:DUF2061 domain-containing protein [Nitrospira sp.]